jgi:aminoglycoside 6'-N-acetyltransferase I
MTFVRPVRHDELSAWVELRQALWPDQTLESLEADATRWLASRAAGPTPPGTMPEGVFVATSDAPDAPGLIGFAEASRRLYAEGCSTSPVGFLEGWYVLPSHRRLGVGRLLLQACEAWARDLGCTEFASDALADNTISRDAHLRLGFAEVEVIRCFRKDLRTRELS